jgi:hypothetical protein
MAKILYMRAVRADLSFDKTDGQSERERRMMSIPQKEGWSEEDNGQIGSGAKRKYKPRGHTYPFPFFLVV